MDLSPYKLDVDEIIREFDEGGFKTLADMKRVWLSRKFSYIFDDIKLKDLAAVMQSMFSQCISHIGSTNTLSHRLGGLFCLYCLYETQPIKPEFKVYLPLGDIRRLKNLVVDAKRNGIKVVSAILRRMIEKNAFLFGFFDINDYSGTEKVRELVDVQNARIKKMHEVLLGNANIECYLQMDLGMEVEVKTMKDISGDYANAKKLAIKEAGKVVDIENIKYIAEHRTPIGENIEMIAEKWEGQKRVFYQETGLQPGKGFRQAEVMQLPAAQQRLEDEEELEPTGFLPLLPTGEEEHRQGDKDIMRDEETYKLRGDENDEDMDYVEDLERQLSVI